MRKILFGKILIIALWVMVLNSAVFGAEFGEGELKSVSALIMDGESGRVLWEKNGYEPMAMASTTKIMTAIYTIEHADLNDTVVVSKYAASQPKVKLFLSEGEEVKLKDLLYALMLRSSNDAACAIAEHVCGSCDEFCAEITEEAKRLGAKDTVFETPNGLDAGDHHSTAYDMALITRYALKNDVFREIIKTPAYSFSSDRRSYSLTNADRLLTEYEGAIGVKTGYTGKAGHCFVGAAERDGKTIISVVLASGWGAGGKAAKWADTKKLLNYGFDNFEKRSIITEGETAGDFVVSEGTAEKGRAVFKDDIETLLKAEEKTDVKVTFDEVTAPVYKGDKVGSAVVYIDGAEYGKVDLISDRDIDKKTFAYNLKKIINKWLSMAG